MKVFRSDGKLKVDAAIITGAQPIALSAGTQSASTGTLVFSNSNGVTFGMSGNTRITASVLPTASAYAVSNTTQSSSGTIPLNALSVHGAGGVSVGISNGSIVVSGGAGGGGGGPALSAGTQSVSTGTVVFSNSNNVTFGMSGSSQITASFSTQPETPFGVSAGTQSVSTGTLVFSNSNNVTFGMSGSSRITASFSTQPETPFGVSAGTQSVSTGTLVFSNSNNVTFGMSGSSQITASFSTQPETPFGVSAGTQSVSTGTLVFSNSNNITFGMSGSSQITASFSTQPETPFGISAGTQSVSTGTLVFSNSNNFTFGMSGSSRITASYTTPVVSNAIQSVGSATGSGTNTSRFAADDHVHAGVFSFGVSTGGNTVGDTRVDVGRFVLQGGDNVTLSQITGANALNTIVISGAAGGGGGGETRLTGYAVGNTTQSSSGTIPLSQLSFRGSGIASVGISNGSVIVDVPSGGGGATSSFYGTGGISISTDGNSISVGVTENFMSGFNPFFPPSLRVVGQQGNATHHVSPIEIHNAMVFDHIGMLLYFSNASNSSMTLSASLYFGIYTKNANTLSLLVSTSSQYTANNQGTGSAATWHGIRLWTIPITSTLTGGHYWVAIGTRSSTAGTNGSFSQVMVSNMASNYSGIAGAASNASLQTQLGFGIISNTSAGVRDSIAFSHLVGSGSLALRQPIFMFNSGTA